MLTYMQLQRPSTLDEAYALMMKQKLAPMLAGGCWLRLGTRKWPMVIDLSKLGLDYIREDADQYAIGAMATQRMVECFEPFQAIGNGILAQAVHPILGVQFRNIATMGGSVASRYGFSDIIPSLCALGASVKLHNAGVMSITDYLKYAQRDLLVEVLVPRVVEGACAIEALRKSASDFPYLTGSIRKDKEGYHIFVGGRPSGAIPVLEAMNILNEKGIDYVEEAAEAGVEAISFQSNSHASSEYRRAMAKNMIIRLAKEVASWK